MIHNYIIREDVSDKIKFAAAGLAGLAGGLFGKGAYLTAKELSPGLKELIKSKSKEKHTKKEVKEDASSVLKSLDPKLLGKLFIGAAGAALANEIVDDYAEAKRKKLSQKIAQKYKLKTIKEELEDDEIETYDYEMTTLPKRSGDIWNEKKAKEKEEYEKKYGSFLNPIRDRVRQRMGLNNSIDIVSYINESYYNSGFESNYTFTRDRSPFTFRFSGIEFFSEKGKIFVRIDRGGKRFIMELDRFLDDEEKVNSLFKVFLLKKMIPIHPSVDPNYVLPDDKRFFVNQTIEDYFGKDRPPYDVMLKNGTVQTTPD